MALWYTTNGFSSIRNGLYLKKNQGGITNEFQSNFK